MTKIEISPADIRACNECLSCLAAAEQWASILEAAGIDVTPEKDRIAANKRIATGVLTQVQLLNGSPTL